MSDPELPREVARWVRYARDDLKVTEAILEHGQVPRAACFNAQQCAEKSIKASLVSLQIPFRKTHDLELLCGELSEERTLGEDPAHLSSLGDRAVGSRYPGDSMEATEADARNAIEQARDVYETTLKDLERRGYVAPSDDGTEQGNEQNQD